MIMLTWIFFDEYIYSIYIRFKNKKNLRVLLIFQDRLCLAVALIHSIGLPLLDKPKNYSQIVDDI